MPVIHGTFDLLTAAKEREAARLEAERVNLVARAMAWLDVNAGRFGLLEAWLFGSVSQPGRFHKSSDVDIAVTLEEEAAIFRLGAELEGAIGKPLDLILLPRTRLAARIRREGIAWTPSFSAG